MAGGRERSFRFGDIVTKAAINWRLKEILLGEVKWTGGPIRRSVVRGLMGKTNLVAPDNRRAGKYIKPSSAVPGLRKRPLPKHKTITPS